MASLGCFEKRNEREEEYAHLGPPKSVLMFGEYEHIHIIEEGFFMTFYRAVDPIGSKEVDDAGGVFAEGAVGNHDECKADCAAGEQQLPIAL